MEKKSKENNTSSIIIKVAFREKNYKEWKGILPND